jgi:HK97 family phage major capsid protein
MDELKRILKLAISERLENDLLYLKEHSTELSEEQKEQLDNEKEIIEQYENPFIKKGFDNVKTLIDKIQQAKADGKYRKLTFKAEVKDLGEGVMEAIISSEALDRHGEKIDMKGMNIKEYMKNPIVADGHDYSKSSVGRTLKLTKKSDGSLISKFEWAKDITERANELYKLYKNKFQYAFSIGFMVDDMDGNTFTKSTMLEFSPVLIPANPEALLLAKQKELDSTNFINYNNINMYKLEEILKKTQDELTVGEIKFLKENIEKLTGEQKTKYASVLEEKKNLTAEDVKGIVEGAVSPLKEELTAMKDKTVQPKDINLNYDSASKYKNASAELQKKLKFLYYVQGVQNKNFANYEKIVGKDAMNTTDDGVVMPPVEFIAEVERLEEIYGVARKFATVRSSTSGNGIKFLQGDDDVEIFDTAEGAAKTSSKMSYASKTLLWRKFAGILPITDELNEDSAINLWQDATTRFARAYTKKEDELVFTETSAVSPKNKGILEVSGVNVVTMSGSTSDDSFNDIEYGDLVDMITGVPTPSAANGRFYFHREILGILMKLKDDEGRPVWLQGVQSGAPATILGKPYELVEVMPSIADDAPDTKFMIFGDLKYSTLGERTGLVIRIFDTGSVGDPDEEDQDANQINLLTQDAQAMRAVKRMNAVCRFPAAFSVLKTATSGS